MCVESTSLLRFRMADMGANARCKNPARCMVPRRSAVHYGERTGGRRCDIERKLWRRLSGEDRCRRLGAFQIRLRKMLGDHLLDFLLS